MRSFKKSLLPLSQPRRGFAPGSCLTLLLLGVSLLSGIELHAQKKDGDTQAREELDSLDALEKDRIQAYGKIASSHVDVAKDCATRKMFGYARWHYHRAMYLDPENKLCREALGFVRKEDKWIAGKAAIPEKDAYDEHSEDHDERNKAQIQIGAISEVYEPLRTSAKSVLLGLARRAKALDNDNVAKGIYREVLRYDPEDKESYEARNFVFRADINSWVPGFVNAAYKRGTELFEHFEDAPVVKIDDEEAKAIGTTFIKVVDGPFEIRSNCEGQRVQKLMRSLRASTKYLVETFGWQERKLLEKSDSIKVTLIHGKELFAAWVNRFDTSDLDKKAKRANSAGGFFRKDLPECVVCEQSDKDEKRQEALRDVADDLVINLCTELFLRDKRAQNYSSWLKIGLCYLATSRILLTAHTKRFRYTSKKRRTDAARRTNSGKARGNPFDPEQLRAMVAEAVEFGLDIPLTKLASLSTNDMDPQAAAKCMSIYEFLLHKHPKAAISWFAKRSNTGSRELKTLTSSYGKDLDTLEGEWRAWVLESY